jgi:hypothetical protein
MTTLARQKVLVLGLVWNGPLVAGCTRSLAIPGANSSATAGGHMHGNRQRLVVARDTLTESSTPHSRWYPRDRARLPLLARSSRSRLDHASRLLGRDGRSGGKLHLEGLVPQRSASDAVRYRPVQYRLERPHVRRAISNVLRVRRAGGEVHDRRHDRRQRHEGRHPGELHRPGRALPGLQLDANLWRDGYGVLRG